MLECETWPRPVVALAGSIAVQSGDDSLFLAVDTFSGGGVYLGDVETGRAGQIGFAGFSPLNSLARSPDGVFYSSAKNGDLDRLITIDPTTGEGTFVADMDFGTDQTGVRALAFSPTGVLFAMRAGLPDLLFRVDTVTGDVTPVAGTTGFSGIQGMDFSRAGKLYGFDVTRGLVVIDPDTAETTDVNSSQGGNPDIQTIAFGPDGQLYGMGLEIWRIDLETGENTLLHAGTWFQFRGAGFLEGPSHPLPSTSRWGLLVLLLAMLTAGEVVRRRQSSRP